VKIVKQDGSPVDAPEEKPTPAEDIQAIVEDVEGAVKEFGKGVKKFRNGFLFKIGVIAVTIKVVDVIGKIVLENQRLKSEERRQQDEG
jgi:hypothetical protein